MKRAGPVLIIGIVSALVAFAFAHHIGTASSRELMRQPQPELAWLKKEFGLTDAEFTRISELHNAYLPKCAARCQVIAEENARLDKLLRGTPAVTPEVETVIARRAKLRSDCEAEMLKHFIEVSHTMPETQGRRYLAWVCEQTSLSGSSMERQHEEHPVQVHHHH